ncbi:hypothetical protein K435DRAFT_807833 [Dendrothele bispora CBS 962.96]|uniref:Uncharacterized protein n=1 Tax=Dendrothele bispora (strain CBS 962.96) TaxID=1314807 RepID=A0A4S8L3I5_DENBC|nr:hypothetical protein K435DRAFT_807833 [Dendrothele bispora CBS 962.96]
MIIRSSSPEGPRKVPARWLCTCGDLAGTLRGPSRGPRGDLAGTLQRPCTDPHRTCGDLAQTLEGTAQGSSTAQESKFAGTLHRPSQILKKYQWCLYPYLDLKWNIGSVQLSKKQN